MADFDFGANWQQFSADRLDESRFAEATRSLQRLFPGDGLLGRSFLDVGCGSGLFALAAARVGASPVVGIDINPTCISTCEQNRITLHGEPSVDFRVMSALDSEAMASLGVFDVTYAWGSLHHTGRMWAAIHNVARTVRPGGTLVLAIYARHISSGAWHFIKRTYNVMPGPIRTLMLWSLVPVIFVAKFAVTWANPLKKERGMDFWYDVIDWVGGYPYEYASPEEIEAALSELGFVLQTVRRASVPTGCHEYVFVRQL